LFHPATIRRFFRLTALAGFFLIPLVFYTEMRDQFELPKMILLGLLSTWIVGSRLLDPRRRRWTALEAAVAVLLVLQGVSCLPGLSLSWRTSLTGDYENFGGWFTALALAGWFFGLARGLRPAEIRKFHFMAVTAGLLSALYSIGQRYGLDFIDWNPDTFNASRVFASLGNPNFLSAYLAMILPLHLTEALGLGRSPGSTPPSAPTHQDFPSTPPRPPLPWTALLLPWGGLFFLLLSTGAVSHRMDYDQTFLPFLLRALGLAALAAGLTHTHFRRGPWAAWGGSLLIGAGLVATESRGGWLGALVGIGILGLLGWRHRSGTEAPERARTWSWARVVSVLFLLGLLAWAGSPFFNRLTRSVAHPLESLGKSRLTIWRPALEMVKAHPWAGVGLDCFKIAFPQYSGFDFNQIDGTFVSSRTAHNEWLQAAATTGMPGLLAGLLVVGLFIRALRQRLRESTNPDGFLWISIAASAAAYLVQNLFSFGVAALLLLWNLHLASVVRPVGDSDPEPRSRPGFLLFLAAVVSIPIGLRLVADLSFARGMAALDFLRDRAGRLTPEQTGLYADYGLEKARRAAELFPLDVKYRLYIGMALEQEAEVPSESREFTLKQALHTYDQVVAFSPSNAYYQNDRARVLIEMARQDPRYWAQAEDALRQACALAPESPFFQVQWGAVLLGMGQRKEAGPPLTKAFTLSPDLSTRTMGQMALDDFTGGDTDLAFTLLSELVRRQPKSAGAWFYQGYLQDKVGKKREAKLSLEKARQLDPQLPGLQAALDGLNH